MTSSVLRHRALLTVGSVAAVALPFLSGATSTSLYTRILIGAVGAIGLNIVTGLTGQVSLGHSFFLAVGAYTAAVLGGTAGRTVIGHDLDMTIWLPAAFVAAAVVGAVVSPIAFRLRGLYLAILTLGMVFVGLHLFREWTSVTGGAGIGRPAAPAVLLGRPLAEDLAVGAVTATSPTQLYLLCLAVFALATLAFVNLRHSAFGRAMVAVRDRDVAAEAMGIASRRVKVVAFALAAGCAGVAGALSAAETGYIEPGSYDVLLSVEYLAIILIGGVGTAAGPLLGAVFVVGMPRIVEWAQPLLPFVAAGTRDDGILTRFELQTFLYGVLIVVFLIAQPDGVSGALTRARDSARTWPFSRLLDHN